MFGAFLLLMIDPTTTDIPINNIRLIAHAFPSLMYSLAALDRRTIVAAISFFLKALLNFTLQPSVQYFCQAVFGKYFSPHLKHFGKLTIPIYTALGLICQYE